MAIEEEFSIEIPDKEADAIHSGMLVLFLYSSTGMFRFEIESANVIVFQSTKQSPTSAHSPMPTKPSLTLCNTSRSAAGEGYNQETKPTRHSRKEKQGWAQLYSVHSPLGTAQFFGSENKTVDVD